MYGIVKKLRKAEMKMCGMCNNYTNEHYLYVGWTKPQVHLEVCKKCAVRELGTRYKNKFDETIKEREKQWDGINLEK
tara:strand:- start:1195 stop:1425 length:231 start_codon:yes stop_codon:yes gene_type:complete